jgi:hypothetical protein
MEASSKFHALLNEQRWGGAKVQTVSCDEAYLDATGVVQSPDAFDELASSEGASAPSPELVSSSPTVGGCVALTAPSVVGRALLPTADAYVAELRAAILAVTGLHASAGIAKNKLLARMCTFRAPESIWQALLCGWLWWHAPTRPRANGGTRHRLPAQRQHLHASLVARANAPILSRGTFKTCPLRLEAGGENGRARRSYHLLYPFLFSRSLASHA